MYEQFWESLSLWLIYFEPIIFNEAIALECGLTPFTHEGKGMLALSGCGMDLSPRLDSYQALVDGTIDKHSRFFSNPNYFESVVGGKDMVQRVREAVSHIN